MKSALFALAALLFAAPVVAQTVYRCGSTYSATPCGEGQKELKVMTPSSSGGRKYKPVDDLATDEMKAGDEKSCFDAVRARLKDPDSAKFSGVSRAVYEAAPGSRQTIVMYSGYVNAKNSYGGYVGPKLFSCELSAESKKAFLLE